MTRGCEWQVEYFRFYSIDNGSGIICSSIRGDGIIAIIISNIY